MRGAFQCRRINNSRSPAHFYMADIQKQIKQLASQEKFKKIVKLIEQIPENERDWETVGAYIRALNNTWQLERSVKVSIQYQEKGASDALWHYRLGYAYLNLDYYDEAEAVLLRGKELAKGDAEVIGWMDELLEQVSTSKNPPFIAYEFALTGGIADCLGINNSEKDFCDAWIGKYVEDRVASPVGTEAKEKISELENEFFDDLAARGDPVNKYVLARIIKYTVENLKIDHWFSSFDYWAFYSFIPAKIKTVRFSVDEFLYLLKNYFTTDRIDVNFSLVKILLLIADKNKYFTIVKDAACRRELFSLFLDYNSKLPFYHDIIGFKKLLKYMNEKDLETITQLKEYKRDDGEVCFFMLRSLFHQSFSSNAWKDFTIKKEIINLFDSAKGARPKQAWTDRFHELKVACPVNELKLWCQFVISNKVSAKDNATGWTNDVVKRFKKSAQWIIECAGQKII